MATLFKVFEDVVAIFLYRTHIYFRSRVDTFFNLDTTFRAHFFDDKGDVFEDMSGSFFEIGDTFKLWVVLFRD